MIVCSCNGISCRDIAEAVDNLIIEDPVRALTPVQIYRAMNKRPRCGGCLVHAAELVNERAACLRGSRGCACKHGHSPQHSCPSVNNASHQAPPPQPVANGAART
jgi:bacterioferritin-associated ferredoxin